MIARELVAGSRASALALAQTRIVLDALARVQPSLSVRVDRVTTRGDAHADAPIATLGRGLFVAELEQALREHRVDFAVHSAKDLPSTMDHGLVLGAILPRADARDALVSRAGGGLAALPARARVGTSSPRRWSQLRALRPDLELVEIRGNVDTRLRKLAAGEFDALVLAAAGLLRLGRADAITEWLDLETVIPCVGQGALAVQARADDHDLLGLLARIDDARTRTAVEAERAFLAELGAGCLAAVGAHAAVEEGRLRIAGYVGSADGRHRTGSRTGSMVDAPHVGSALARELLRDGAAAFLAKEDGPLAGARIIVTRPREQCEEILELLRARGAHPVSCPTIAVQPPRDSTALDSMLRTLQTADWIVFTSANAVRAVAKRLEALRLAMPARVRLAAIGGATADVAAAHFRAPEFIAPRAGAAALAATLPVAPNQEVVFVRGDLATTTLASGLEGRGARVRSVIAYHTVAGVGADRMRGLLAARDVDAVLFASPSSIGFAAAALAAARADNGALPALVCIGPTTASAARDLGFEPDGIAAAQTVGGMVDAVERCLAARRLPAGAVS